MVPMTKVIKGTSFRWTPKAHSAFEEIKAKLTQTRLLPLPCFNKIFIVDCDASGIGIGGVLIEEGKSFAFFSEELSYSRHKYSTYDEKFDAIMRCLKHSSNYLIGKDLILHADYETLKYIKGQKNKTWQVGQISPLLSFYGQA